MDEEKYDVVLDVLQKHRDKLWDMTKGNGEWGIMDQIRLRQIEELQDAMDIWVKYKPQDDDDERPD
jgi:hypothetical protein